MSNRYNISIRIFPSILQKQRMQPHATKTLNATYFYDTEKSFKHAILRVDNKKVRTFFTDIPKTTHTT